MVKRREKAFSVVAADQEERIAAFAAGADREKIEKLDTEAPRNYKKINVPFNEYEFNQLERAALKMGRSKLDYIRRSMLEQAKRDAKKAALI
jgi:uncharacterized protein YpuA (DUF1002 family)